MNTIILPPPSFQCKNCKCDKCIAYYATYESKQRRRIEYEKQEEKKKADKKAAEEATAKRADELHLKYKCKQFVNVHKWVHNYHDLPYTVDQRRRCLNNKISGEDYCKRHQKYKE